MDHSLELQCNPYTQRSLLFQIFRHKENNRIRVLMRQEKTMKVIANHFLDPRIVLTPNVGNDKSWVWVAFDFSDGELVETVSVFALFCCTFFPILMCFIMRVHARDCYLNLRA